MRAGLYVFALGIASFGGSQLAALAAPPGSAYNPAETLTPNCLPSTTNCTVQFNYAAKAANGDITSLSGLTTPLSAGQGGTGLNSYASGDVIYASSANTLSALHVGTDGQVLTISGGVPMWLDPTAFASTTGSTTNTYSAGTGLTLVGSVFSVNQSQLDLSLIGGVLPVAKGGTGQTSFASNALLYASGPTTVASFPNGNEGEVLKIVSGAPTWVSTTTLGVSSSGTVYSAGSGLSLVGTTFSVNESALNIANMTGVLGTAHGGTGLSSVGSNGQVLSVVAGAPTWIATSSLGVTGGGIAYSAGSGLNLAGTTFSVDESALDISHMTGVLGIAHGGTGLSSGGSNGQILSIVSGSPAWVATSSLNISNSGGADLGAVSGIIKADGSGNVSAAQSGTDYELPLSFSFPLSRSANSVALAAGYTIPLQASTSEWNVFLQNPSSRITAGTHLSWSGNTLNASFIGITTDDIPEGTNKYFSNGQVATYINSSSTIAHAAGGTSGNLLSWNGTAWVSVATSSLFAAGGTYESPLLFSFPLARTGDTISVASGRTIPLVASTTEWASFYQSPSARITAGTHLSWSGNTLNANFTGITTDDITEGNNKFYSNSQVASYISGSSTIAHAAGGTSGNILSWNGSAWVSVATSTLFTVNASTTWSSITGTPTSLAGYGVANGAALDNLGAVGTAGMLVRTGAGTYAARTIQGTSNRITLTNGDGVSGNPSVDIAPTYVGQTSITTLGTITAGIWNGTAVDAGHGGTGQTTYSVGDILYASGAGTLSRLSATTNGSILSLVGGSPAWVATSSLGLASSTVVSPGLAGQMAYYAMNGSTVSGTSTMTISSAGKVGVGSSTPNDLLSVGGTASVVHLKGQGGTPSASAGAALTLGSGGSVVVRGTDTAGEITFTLGSGGVLGLGALVTLTFATPYGTAPFVVLTPASSAAAQLPLGLTALNLYVNSNTTGFTVTGLGVTISGAATYKWNYIVVQ